MNGNLSVTTWCGSRTLYRRIQRRITLIAGAGFAVCVGGVFLPWPYISDAGFLVFLASGAAAFLVFRKHERAAMYRALNDRQTENERTLRAIAYGDTVDDLKSDALRQGAALFGENADLYIVHVAHMATSLRRDRGAFTADVIVRAHPGSIPAREVVTP